MFRALNRADNADLENGVITDENGGYTKIRTDRERWEENGKNPKPRYEQGSSLTLMQIYDHIKMRYRKDTNCISLSSNANVSIVYGRGSYTDKYVMIKIPKKEMGDKVVNAGEYMLSEIEKKVQEAIENLPKEDSSDIVQIIEQIDSAGSLEKLTDILLSTYKLNEESTMNYTGTKIKGVQKNSVQSRLGNYSALNEAQTLKKNKIVAKLTILEQRKLMEPIIPHTANNSKLLATVGNAFSSSELIHYGDIPGDKITEVSKEFMDILALLQQEKERNPDRAETVDKIENEIITYINNGYKIEDRSGKLVCTNGSTEIDLGSSSFLQSANNTPQRISIKDAYDLTKK